MLAARPCRRPRNKQLKNTKLSNTIEAREASKADGRNPYLAQRADNAHGDFTAIGDQDLAEHFSDTQRLPPRGRAVRTKRRCCLASRFHCFRRDQPPRLANM